MSDFLLFRSPPPAFIFHIYCAYLFLSLSLTFYRFRFSLILFLLSFFHFSFLLPLSSVYFHLCLFFSFSLPSHRKVHSVSLPFPLVTYIQGMLYTWPHFISPRSPLLLGVNCGGVRRLFHPHLLALSVSLLLLSLLVDSGCCVCNVKVTQALKSH